MNNIKEFIDKYAELLPLGSSISLTEAEHRAGEFLHAMAIIANHKHTLSGDKIKALSVQTAIYADQLTKGTAKTITENKITAEASGVYMEAREELEHIENDISYLKAYQDVFLNAHLFYRQLSKGENV